MIGNSKKLKGDFVYSKYADQRKYADVDNLDDYIALTPSERERWGFWYKEPNSYLVGGGDFDAFWKKHYPIQYRIREFCFDVKIWFGVKKRQWYEKVTCRIWPKNQWARDAIPNIWSDKMSLIEDFLFAVIVDFVEKENETPIVDWDYDEHHRKIWARVMAVYNFIKVELPARQEKAGVYLRSLYRREGESIKDQIRNFMAFAHEKSKRDKKVELALQLYDSETQELIQ